MKPFSVVIPTYNNASTRRGSLRAVLASLGHAHQVIQEVIVVDNGSTDAGPAELVHDTVLPLVLTRREPSGHPTAARNHGWHMAKAPFIVSMDDDIVLTDDVLQAVAAELAEDRFWTWLRLRFLPMDLPRSDLLHGAASVDRSWLVGKSTLAPGTEEAVYDPMKASLFAHITPFGVVPRRLLERCGGFDERFTGWGVEDVELMIRLTHHARLVNLSRRALALHVDHLISPYQTPNQARNERKLAAIWAERGYRLSRRAFYRRLKQGQDVTLADVATADPQAIVDLLPVRSLGRAYAQWLDELRPVVAKRGGLIGGFWVPASPEHADEAPDLIVVTEQGWSQWYVRSLNGFARPLRLQLTSERHVHEILPYCLGLLPSGGLAHIDRLARARPLFGRVDHIAAHFKRLADIAHASSLGSLPHAVGELALLAENSGNGSAGPDVIALERRIAALIEEKALPQEKSRLIGRPGESSDFASPASVLRRVQAMLTQASPPDDRTVVWRNTLEHGLGLELLASVHPAWKVFLDRVP